MSNLLDNPTSFGTSFDGLPEFIKHPIQTVKRLFDWDVVEQDLTTFGPHAYGDVKGYKAIVRSGGDPADRILHVAPKSYQVITNAQFEEIADDYINIGCKHVAHGTFNNGRQLWIQLQCPEMLKQWMVGGMDKVKAYLTLFTSHDTSLLLKGLLMMLRPFCQNQFTMIRGAQDTGFSIKHTKSAESRICDAREQIATLGDLARQTVESFDLLNATPININENRQFFIDLFEMKKAIRHSMVNGEKLPSFQPEYSGKALNTLKALENAYQHPVQSNLGHNAWRLLNAVTYYVDHSDHISKNRRDKGYHILPTGGGTKLKFKAYKKLLDKARYDSVINADWQPSGVIG